MDLHTQITTLLFSLGYGFIFSFLLDIVHKYYLKWSKFIQIIFAFLYVITSSIVYFYILLKINNALLHPYFIILFIFGFLLEFVMKKTFKKIVFSFKK